MKIKSSNPLYHILYIIFVFLTLMLVFGRSWHNRMAAFYFVSMLLPVVLGTSYFFNYVLVPKFYLKKKYFRFGLYTFYTFVFSLYFETLVLLFSLVYLEHFTLQNMSPNASDTLILALVLYLLVFLGSFLLMTRQIKENQQLIQDLMVEKEKMEKAFLEIMSNRKMTKIPYDEIIYIESLADYIKVNTIHDEIISKEKISNVAKRLPDIFLRIHRSFIVNKEKIKSFSYNEVQVGEVYLNIGRSYREAVRESMKNRSAKQ
ncbi:MAG: LytTR family transcriptional regulator [Bacteroidales bacterium]|nr:LytTR family transcriptional regulator [Bacteroidales bacterium]